MRRGELLKLQWGDIDFDNKLLHVRAENTKSGKPRWLPLTKALWAFLKLYRQRIPEQHGQPTSPVFQLVHSKRRRKSNKFPYEWVYANPDTREPLSESAHEQAWRRICNRAGLDNLHFHDLRHTAATSFAHKPVELTTRENAYMLGHTTGETTRMTRKYEHLELVEDIRIKLEKMFPVEIDHNYDKPEVEQLACGFLDHMESESGDELNHLSWPEQLAGAMVQVEHMVLARLTFGIDFIGSNTVIFSMLISFKHTGFRCNSDSQLTFL
jgi:hypothetical protein